MRATMSMSLDTMFGNQVELGLMAELDNPHELTNRSLFTDMARLMKFMVEEIRSSNEQWIAAQDSVIGGAARADRNEDG